MNTYRDAYDKAVKKADGILEWHTAIVDKIERVHAIVMMEQYAGIHHAYYTWMLTQLHSQKVCAERDYRKAEDIVKLAWIRFMEYGKRWE